MASDIPDLPKLTPIARPLNLIPVHLKEAALDSPTFRATTVHFGDQIDAIERWLDSYIKAAGRLANEITSIENLVNNYIGCAAPPVGISEAALDLDYTTLAIARYHDGAREFWGATIKWMKKVESTVIDPIKGFINHDLVALKSLRRTLEMSQRAFDGAMARFSAQSKSKDNSSLREDAFQLFEARKAYLKASMDYCVAAPQLRSALDKLLVRIFSDRWREMKSSRDSLSSSFAKWTTDVERVRGWSKEMESYERVFAQELELARQTVEQAAEQRIRPSRDLDSYSVSTVPFLGTQPAGLSSPKKNAKEASEKQGWLFQRTIAGKPARTYWIRRWFYVKNGVFGWLSLSAKYSSVEESEKIGVLLCGVRPAFQEERRFCFEVKTKDSTLILQAETQTELMEWIAAFEVVKRRALENPSGPGSGGSQLQGAPFAITPAIAPEFAAQPVDVQPEEGIDRASTFANDGAQQAARGSVDARRHTNVDRETDSLRHDTAARIIQKLDVHRKGNGGSSSSGTPQLGGIASLIAASHSAMPIAPVMSTPITSHTDLKKIFTSTIPTTTLAPSTLANPPLMTTLSKAAVVIGAEKGLSISGAGEGGLPGGLMANIWGSRNWGYVNRLERHGVVERLNRPTSSATSRNPSPARAPGDQIEIKVDEAISSLAELEQVRSAPVSPNTSHRKSMSASPDPAALRQILAEEYPNYYPLSLKAQDAQFRMLFPEVPRSDKLCLVFMAAWNSGQQEFPGRVYVTAKDLYFYSNHLGFVLITGVSLSTVSEITGAPGKDCDFLFIHLKDGVTTDGSTRVTVKLFLEPLRLLQQRLDFLVRNCQSDEPLSLEETIKNLIKQEAVQGDESPIDNSWEDISAEVGHKPLHQRGHDLKTSLHIDGSLYGDPSKKVQRNATKFRLPAHPVEYTPQGFFRLPLVEKQYDVTAKSLFHTLAGDKSAVFQILYCQRGAIRLVQGPWIQPDNGHHRREIRYEIKNSKRHFEVADYQVIDVLNDHLCYVITERKTAWFLPKSNYFTVVLKIVITHVAKSHCKLSMFGRIEWSKKPLFGQGLIDHQANAYLQSYATALADIAADQASRLGVQGGTSARRAVNIFGNVGQNDQSVQLMASDLAIADRKGSKHMRYRSLPRLIMYAARRVVITYSFVVLGLLMELGKWVTKTLTANSIIILLLAASVGYSTLLTGRGTSEWWQERRAATYMARLGVQPNAVIARSVWLKDVDTMIRDTRVNSSVTTAAPGSCYQSFTTLLDDVDPSTPPGNFHNDKSLTKSSRSMIARVSRSRQNLGSYRHDLLVALRLIGKVEQEMLAAEWENWVVSESARCSMIQRLLGTMNEEKAQEIRNWWHQYCSSCLGVMNDLEQRTMSIS